MNKYFEECGLEVNEECEQKFEEFKNLLLDYNKLCNLTAVCDEEGVYIKHFCDSILPARYFPAGANVVEIGSGGGFPSIPLKIVRGDLKFMLIESTLKKCAFLSTAAKSLGLEGVEVLNMRAEDAGRMQNLREKFDVCTARAVAALNTLCEYCLPFVKVGGIFVAYKGICAEELEESKGAIEILGGKLDFVKEYSLPRGLGARSVIVIKKICATPSKYPRGRGMERKKPL